jgi:hypothetical protein
VHSILTPLLIRGHDDASSSSSSSPPPRVSRNDEAGKHENSSKLTRLTLIPRLSVIGRFPSRLGATFAAIEAAE